MNERVVTMGLNFQKVSNQYVVQSTQSAGSATLPAVKEFNKFCRPGDKLIMIMGEDEGELKMCWEHNTAKDLNNTLLTYKRGTVFFYRPWETMNIKKRSTLYEVVSAIPPRRVPMVRKVSNFMPICVLNVDISEVGFDPNKYAAKGVPAHVDHFKQCTLSVEDEIVDFYYDMSEIVLADCAYGLLDYEKTDRTGWVEEAQPVDGYSFDASKKEKIG